MKGQSWTYQEHLCLSKPTITKPLFKVYCKQFPFVWEVSIHEASNSSTPCAVSFSRFFLSHPLAASLRKKMNAPAATTDTTWTRVNAKQLPAPGGQLVRMRLVPPWWTVAHWLLAVCACLQHMSVVPSYQFLCCS